MNTQTISIFILLSLLLLIACDLENPSGKVDNTQPTALFKSIPVSQSGIDFSNTIEENYEKYFVSFMYVYNGGGVAAGDINGDGLVDLYFTGNEISNKLYLNKGNFQFEDITLNADVGGDNNWDNGVTMIDVNSDGFQDIYVSRGGWQDADSDRKNLLYINQGDLTFKEQAQEYGLDDSGYSMQATFFDLDNDNDLDMYLMNRPDSFMLELNKMDTRRYAPPADSRDKLYINYGGKFVEEGFKRGMGENYGYGLSAVAADLNQDGYTDLYVTNDFSIEDYYWINQGDGTFQQRIKTMSNHIALYAMGADITDMNNDGLEDIMVMEMRPSDYVRSKVSMPPMSRDAFFNITKSNMHKQYMHNMFFLNQGTDYFSEISQYAGISNTDWSWSVLSSDLDNDGLRDLFITNGMKRDFFDGDVHSRIEKYVQENKHAYKSAIEMFQKDFSGIINSYKPIKINNYLYQNKGGLKYEDVSQDWGFNESSFSNGALVADLDNDGDLDLVTNNFDDPAFIYENTSNGSGNWITLSLNGPTGNPDGLGAKVTIYQGKQSQLFQNKTARGYLSSSDPRVHFGLNQNVKIDSLIVQWPDGKVSREFDVSINKFLTVEYQDANSNRLNKPKYTPIFKEVTKQVLDQPFEHQENTFDEFRQQILLPHMFSKSGPFTAVADLDGDGDEDFYIGGAKGQSGQFYFQQNGVMVPRFFQLFKKDKEFEDMGVCFADLDLDGDSDLIVASGGGEFPEGHPLYRDRIYFNDGKGNFNRRDFLPSQSSGSCVVPEDIDDDGDIDLFIGGQVIAERYVHSPNSYLYINDGGNFTDESERIAPDLCKAGMVQSAIWADVDGDKTKELIVVGEWTPVMIFKNKNGRFEEVSQDFGLQKTEGWWNRVIANDLDDDGDIDLILGNLGENYKFTASKNKPFEVFVDDFDKNGTNDIFLAKHSEAKLLPIRGRECTSDQMPVIAQRFPTFTSFAYADVSQIIGLGIENAAHKKAYLMSSIILENENGQFKIKKLPAEAQFSTMLGVQVADYNKDGIKDLLIAGNKFDVEVETTPADASPGYLLMGRGGMEFDAVNPAKSGLMIPYNVKDIQSIQIGDKTNILVSINDGAMKVIEVQ